MFFTVRAGEVPRSMKMGTIASPWQHDFTRHLPPCYPTRRQSPQAHSKENDQFAAKKTFCSFLFLGSR